MTNAFGVGLSMTLLGCITIALVRRARSVRARNRVLGRGIAGDGVRVRRSSAFWRQPPLWLLDRVDGTALPVAIEEGWRWWCIAAASAVVIGWLANGPVLALIGLALVGVTPMGALSIVQSRNAAAYDATLASALDAIARGVRSGGSLPAAIGEAGSAVRGPVAEDIEQIASAIKRGTPLADSLLAWSARRARASVRLAVGALVLAADTGGPPARVIEEVGGALRQRLQLEGEARAMAAQARLSAIVVGCAPIAFAALTCATDAHNAHLLFGTPIGIGCVVLGLTLDAVGAAWMHRISESIVG